MTTVRRVIALAVAVVVVAPRAGMALDAACGLTVPPGETAVLQGDLTCPSDPVAITLDKASTLDLNGFTLSVTAAGATGVVCAAVSCSVVSSAVTAGVISGESTGAYGIEVGLGNLEDVTRLFLDNVVVRDVEDVGIYGTGVHGKTVLNNVTVSGCGHEGINVIRRLVVNNVVSNDNADGIVGPLLLQGVGLTLNGNADKGMWHIGRAVLTGLMASGNGIAGVQAGSIRLRDSTLSGNGEADIVSGRRPRLENTTCERSAILVDPVSGSWGVCSLDP